MNNYVKSKLTGLLRLIDKGKLKHAYFGQDRNKNRTIHTITFVVEVGEDLTKDI